MKINCNKWKKHTNKSTNMQYNYKVTDISMDAQNTNTTRVKMKADCVEVK